MKKLVSYLKTGSRPGRIPELDGLRALAIILILLHHFATYYREIHGSYFRALFPDVISQFLFNAWLGVDLFFVLSGYLIFHHLLKLKNPKDASAIQSNQSNGYTRYALKRILRTFPLYIAIILILAMGLIPYYRFEPSGLDYLVHGLFLQDYFGADILVPLWSLATEEKFYLLAPLLLFFISKMRLTLAIMLILTFMVLMTGAKIVLMEQGQQGISHIQFFEQYRAPFHYAVISILVGVVVALLCELSTPRKLPLLTLLASVMLILALFVCQLYNPANWFWANVIHFLMVIGFGLVIWTATTQTGAWYMRFLCGRTLRVIAVWSYALYVAHYAVLPWANRLHRQYIRSEEAWVHAASFFAIYLGLAVVFSWVLHYVVEKPFLILKERL